jgi:adenylosuccinate synthase
VKGCTEILIGAQWGDEGKGRVVDALAGKTDVIVRYQGGANAGHTVIVGSEKHVFHLLPSGMLYTGKLCIIGNGVVVDPEQLLLELQELQAQGKDRARLVVSRDAHVVLPYHKVLDGADEAFRGKERAIGTTKRGIGPCYVDKYNRMGITMGDLVKPEVLREKLSQNVNLKNMLLTRIYGMTPLPFESIYQEALEWGAKLAPYLGDASLEVHKALEEGKGVLLEGAQGTLLDVDFGTYPYVTSSNPTAAGGCIGSGVGPTRISRVIGVVKAYCTRVGEGPFPTEDFGEWGDYLRDKGGEFGATTGRPRRCGWLDMVALRYAVRINGLGVLALTKLDVLSGLEEIQVALEYSLEGKQYREFTPSASFLENVEPRYVSLPGWQEDISKCRSFEELPQEAQNYVKFIEEHAEVPVGLIGVGPGREETILRNF